MTTRRPGPAPVPRSAFAGFCFPPDVIVLAVRWYLRFGLSYRDVEALLDGDSDAAQSRRFLETIARHMPGKMR